MAKSINKQYKFVYMRNDRYDRSFDGNDFSDIRAKYPKFVFANKNPDKHMYGDGIRANDFMMLYLGDYNYTLQKSFTEGEWTEHIITYCKKHIAEMKQQLKICKNVHDKNTYFAQVRMMLIPIYQHEIKVWKQKHKQLSDQGVYTYLELVK